MLSRKTESYGTLKTVVGVVVVVVIIILVALNRRLKMGEDGSECCLYIIFNACVIEFHDVVSLTVLMKMFFP